MPALTSVHMSGKPRCDLLGDFMHCIAARIVGREHVYPRCSVIIKIRSMPLLHVHTYVFKSIFFFVLQHKRGFKRLIVFLLRLFSPFWIFFPTKAVMHVSHHCSKLEHAKPPPTFCCTQIIPTTPKYFPCTPPFPCKGKEDLESKDRKSLTVFYNLCRNREIPPLEKGDRSRKKRRGSPAVAEERGEEGNG